MRTTYARYIVSTALACMLAFLTVAAQAVELLPSWSDGSAKRAIVDFVTKATQADSPDFVPEAQRVATFDNDGTLWAEEPLYFQLVFALDRVKTLAPQHPEWKDKEPFASLLKGTRGAYARVVTTPWPNS